MNSPVKTFIALGTNIEPRAERLAKARAMLQKISIGGWQQSPVYETAPVGPGRQGMYLNQVVAFWCARNALQVLHILKGIELLQGRQIRGRWESREIDLDLIYYGNDIRTDLFTLPHPQLHLRQFVLQPLCDLDPDWMDPLRGCSVRNLLEELQNHEGTMRFRIVETEE